MANWCRLPFPRPLEPAGPHSRPFAERAVSVRYEARSCWESYVGPDTYQTSTITKPLSLSGQLLAEWRVALDFRTSPPVLTKPEDLESLETMALRLAELYVHVVVQAAPTGHFEAVLNHVGLLQTWEALAQNLREFTTAEDRISPMVLDAGAQLVFTTPIRAVETIQYPRYSQHSCATAAARACSVLGS